VCLCVRVVVWSCGRVVASTIPWNRTSGTRNRKQEPGESIPTTLQAEGSVRRDGRPSAAGEACPRRNWHAVSSSPDDHTHSDSREPPSFPSPSPSPSFPLPACDRNRPPDISKSHSDVRLPIARCPLYTSIVFIRRCVGCGPASETVRNRRRGIQRLVSPVPTTSPRRPLLRSGRRTRVKLLSPISYLQRHRKSNVSPVLP